KMRGWLSSWFRQFSEAWMRKRGITPCLKKSSLEISSPASLAGAAVWTAGGSAETEGAFRSPRVNSEAETDSAALLCDFPHPASAVITNKTGRQSMTRKPPGATARHLNFISDLARGSV